MIRRVLVGLLAAIALLVVLASTPALGEIRSSDGGERPRPGAHAQVTPEAEHQQNLQAIENLRVSQRLGGAPSEPAASQLATVGVALAFVAVQVSLVRTLRRRATT